MEFEGRVASGFEGTPVSMKSFGILGTHYNHPGNPRRYRCFPNMGFHLQETTQRAAQYKTRLVSRLGKSDSELPKRETFGVLYCPREWSEGAVDLSNYP